MKLSYSLSSGKLENITTLSLPLTSTSQTFVQRTQDCPGQRHLAGAAARLHGEERQRDPAPRHPADALPGAGEQHVAGPDGRGVGGARHPGLCRRRGHPEATAAQSEEDSQYSSRGCEDCSEPARLYIKGCSRLRDHAGTSKIYF